jgi:predicted N-acetyltransferase YhbS
MTYVAVHGGRVLGFATVAPRHIDIEDLPQKTRKKLPRYPITVLGVARLAVDTSAQSMGLGSQLLRFTLGLAANMPGDVGCAGVVVDAKPGAVEFYARFGFAPFQPLEGESDARPQPVTMWLSIEAIQKATG